MRPDEVVCLALTLLHTEEKKSFCIFIPKAVPNQITNGVMKTQYKLEWKKDENLSIQPENYRRKKKQKRKRHQKMNRKITYNPNDLNIKKQLLSWCYPNKRTSNCSDLHLPIPFIHWITFVFAECYRFVLDSVYFHVNRYHRHYIMGGCNRSQGKVR